MSSGVHCWRLLAREERKGDVVGSPCRVSIGEMSHVRFDPWMMRPTDDVDDICEALRDPVLKYAQCTFLSFSQGRCRLIYNILRELNIDMLPMKFMEPEHEIIYFFVCCTLVYYSFPFLLHFYDGKEAKVVF